MPEMKDRTPARASSTVEAAGSRRLARYLAAAFALAVAVIYFLIGLSVVEVVTPKPGEGAIQAYFGIPAALTFLLGAVLLMGFDKRLLWVLGTVLQVMIISMYFGVAASREPHYELWGILIRVIQVPLTFILAYLALQPAARTETRRRAQLA
jgi:hypothetical protein